MAAYGTFEPSQAGTPPPWRAAKLAAGLFLVLVSATLVAVPVWRTSELLARPTSLATLVHKLPASVVKVINASADPCVDFHEWACGNYEAHAIIPEDKTSVSYAWDTDSDTLMHRLRGLFESDKGPAGRYYAACMDTAHLEELGTTPLQPVLHEVNAVVDKMDLAKTLARLHQMRVNAFFGWWVGADHSSPDRNLLWLKTGGLTLPSSSYYTKIDDRNSEHWASFLTFYGNALRFLGEEHPNIVAQQCWDIEEALARHEHERDPLYHPSAPVPTYNVSDLVARMPGFDWVTYFEVWGHSDISTQGFDQIAIAHRPWFRAFSHLLLHSKVEHIRSYLKCHVARTFSALLPDKFLHNTLVLDKDLYGDSQLHRRWRKCSLATRTALPFVVSKLFVDHYFPPSEHAAATALADDIKSAMAEDIRGLEWMSPAARKAALFKLDRMLFNIGYPDDWSKYLETVRVDHGTYLANFIRCKRFETAREWNELRTGSDRSFWRHAPVITNAFYNDGTNSAFINVAMLQPPFYDPHKAMSLNFGAVGSVIGHELTHGFDSKGRRFDAYGRKRSWWDPETVSEYKERTKCFIKLYDDFTFHGLHVNGPRTIGEDVADIGGLKIAYMAFEKQAGASVTIDDRRMFWVSHAMTRCGKTRTETEETLIQSDPHPPKKFRLLGAITQLEQFARDFNCPAGSPMNPKKRCELW